MVTLLTLAGLYLIWFALRVSIFNYSSQDEAIAKGSKDIQIYFGGIPVLLMGMGMIVTAVVISQ